MIKTSIFKNLDSKNYSKITTENDIHFCFCWSKFY